MNSSETIFCRPISSLQPSQIYLNRDKLDSIKRSGSDALQKPIFLKPAGGSYIISDGHHRAFLIWLAGGKNIATMIDEDDYDAYDEECLKWCEAADIRVIGDLAARILDTPEYEELWIGRCQAMLSEISARLEQSI